MRRPAQREIGDKMKNKRILCFILAAVTAITLFSPVAYAAEASDIVVYVSPDGDDSADGTEAEPFRTLVRARNAVRERRAAGEHATVILRGGNYTQTDTFVLSSEDGNTTYRAYEGETPVISGLCLLDGDRFAAPAEDDPLVARIKDDTARAEVLTYDLSDVDADCLSADFFFGTERALKCRYPNSGYVLGFNDPDTGNQVEGKTYYDKSGVVSTWDPDSVVGVEVMGNFEIDWSTSSGYISAYDPSTNRVTLSTSSFLSVSGRYYYQNIIEELDSVGEYYVDPDRELMYFYAPDDYAGMNIGFVRCSGNLVSSSADGVEFDGIIFEGAGGSGIAIGASDNVVRNCVIRFTKTGIRSRGYRNVIDNNEIYHIGGTGIDLTGGDELRLIPSNSEATNNLIHDFGETNRVYNGGIYADGIGLYAAHNEIHTGPHLAVSEAAKDFIFEYNYIHDVCYEAGDAGAIYLGGFSCNGGAYRYNLIENINNDMSIYYCPNGFYCDDGGSGKEFSSNVIVNVDGNGIAMGGGRDNIICDNIVIDAGFGYDQRGYYPGTGGAAGWTLVQRFPDGTNWLSLIPWDSEVWGHVNKTPAYGTKTWAYRNAWVMVMKTTNVPDLDDNYVPYAYGTLKVRNNILASSAGKAVRNYEISNNPGRLGVFRNNITMTAEEIGLADFSGGDYRLSEDSPIYRLIPGFRSFDTSLVGRSQVSE